MKIKQLKLRRLGILAILAVGFFTMSCEKEDIEIEETQAIAEEQVISQVVEPTTQEYRYHYNGGVYSEQEFEAMSNNMKTTNFSMIGLNDDLYIFNDKSKALAFMDLEIPRLMDDIDKKPILIPEGDTVIGSGTVKYKINFHADKNYLWSNTVFIHHGTLQILRKQNSWGQPYLTGNKYEKNLPSIIDDRISSYKVTLIQNTSVNQMISDYGGIIPVGSSNVNLRMYSNFYTGTLSDGTYPRWHKLLTYINTSHQDNDLQNNRMWGIFGVTSWNDQISSFDIEFIN